MSKSLWAAMTKIPQTGWLKRENFLSDSSHNPGSWESKIKAPTDAASGERVKALLPLHRWHLLTVSSHEKGKEGGRERGFSRIQSPLVPEATTLFFPSCLHCPIHLLQNGFHFLPQLPLISKLLTTGHPRPLLPEKGLVPSSQPLQFHTHLGITQAPAQRNPLLPAAPSPVALLSVSPRHLCLPSSFSPSSSVSPLAPNISPLKMPLRSPFLTLPRGFQHATLRGDRHTLDTPPPNAELFLQMGLLSRCRCRREDSHHPPASASLESSLCSATSSSSAPSSCSYDAFLIPTSLPRPSPQTRPFSSHPRARETHFSSWEESVKPALHVTNEETEAQRGGTCAQDLKLCRVRSGIWVSWPFHCPTDKPHSSPAPHTALTATCDTLECLPISAPGWTSSHTSVSVACNQSPK